jgi:hypothetical protein
MVVPAFWSPLGYHKPDSAASKAGLTWLSAVTHYLGVFDFFDFGFYGFLPAGGLSCKPVQK